MPFMGTVGFGRATAGRARGDGSVRKPLSIGGRPIAQVQGVRNNMLRGPRNPAFGNKIHQRPTMTREQFNALTPYQQQIQIHRMGVNPMAGKDQFGNIVRQGPFGTKVTTHAGAVDPRDPNAVKARLSQTRDNLISREQQNMAAGGVSTRAGQQNISRAPVLRTPTSQRSQERLQRTGAVPRPERTKKSPEKPVEFDTPEQPQQALPPAPMGGMAPPLQAPPMNPGMALQQAPGPMPAAESLVDSPILPLY